MLTGLHAFVRFAWLRAVTDQRADIDELLGLGSGPASSYRKVVDEIRVPAGLSSLTSSAASISMTSPG